MSLEKTAVKLGFIALSDAAPLIVAKAKGFYRDEGLAGGHRWESPAAALSYALSKAQEVISKQSRVLVS